MGLKQVEVTLNNLRHDRPEDLDILLVSPSGKKIMLMSDAGGSYPVRNATLVFHCNYDRYPFPPQYNAIPSNQTNNYSICNYGQNETILPGAPQGPYDDELDNLSYSDANPNGIWKLYIYDDEIYNQGCVQGSWSLKFYYNE